MLEELAAIERPSGSAGSRAAARIVARGLKDAGAREAWLEEERVHGTYWWPIGLLSALAAAGGAVRSRALAAASGLLAGAGLVDELWVGEQRLRRLLPKRTAVNVTASFGPPDAARTVVVHAHHDAAHSGLIFNPKLARALGRATGCRLSTTPPAMWGVPIGPALVAAGAVAGSGRLRAAGALSAAIDVAVMADIARAPVVPGANDNLSSVAALHLLAQDLAHDPPRDTRVLLLSTDSEESFLEGMRAWLARHRGELPRERTTFLCLESVGSGRLVALDGEGMLKLHRYPDGPRERLLAAARAAGVAIEPRFRFRFATDGQVPLLAGYPVATLASVDWYRAPRNYHWPSDDPEHVDRESTQAAARLASAFVRALG